MGKRAHLQTCIWKALVLLDPPDLDPHKYGYLKHEPSKSLLPVTVPAGVALAPDEIISLIRCSCSEGTRRCITMTCSCCRTRVPCTVFCKCNADAGDDAFLFICFFQRSEWVCLLVCFLSFSLSICQLSNGLTDWRCDGHRVSKFPNSWSIRVLVVCVLICFSNGCQSVRPSAF